MSDTSSEPNYQDILNKYAAELSQNPPEPEAPIEPQPQTESQPQPEPAPENLASLPQPEPQAQLIESQPEAPIEPQPQVETQPEPIAPPPPATPAPPVIPPSDDLYTPLTSEPATDKGNGFFKVLFFLSLFLFIGVAAAVVYSFINSQKPLSNNQNTPITGSSPTISASTCKINEQEYIVGESFAATDGCNTCTCHPDLTISCTEKACDTSPSATIAPSKTSTNSGANTKSKTK